MPRRDRLTRGQFDLALTRGRRLSSPYFSIVLSDHATGYAVVVPKKVARLSVSRHRIKRRVLHALRTLELPQSCIVFPKAAVATLPFPALRAELSVLLGKFGA